MTLTSVACAVCGGTGFDLVFPSTIQDPQSHPADYFSSSRRHAGHLAIVRCRRCSLLLTNPRDDDATLAKVYGQLVDTDYVGAWDSRRRTAQEYFKLIATDHPQPDRLLDVGCAVGLFAGVAHAHGWEVTGIDASEWAIDRAREHCPGATFITGFIEESAIKPEAFSVVTLWDVMEHVKSPLDTLRCIHRWLRPNGSLYLNVPNAESIVARWMGRHWVLLLREHLWYFTPQTMDRLLRQSGFELIRVRPHQVRFSIANVLRRSAQYPNGFGELCRRITERKAIDRWLQRWMIRFPIGEMTIVATKCREAQ